MKPVLPPKFTADFREALKDHYKAEPLIPFILKQPHLDEQCAALLWPCVNGSTAHYVAMSAKWIARWDSKFEDAIQGADAEIDIYTNLISDPARAKSASNRKREHVTNREKHKALPSKKMGRDQDWTIVLRTKESLESILCKSLPYATLAALLNAAYEASGQVERSYSPAAIGVALRRLSR